jgi:transcriptional regulator with XRE-family HTH domain
MDESEILQAFGQKLQSIRTSKGFSQEKLALLAGLDRTYVSSVERGRRNISLLNIFKLATALGVFPTRLFAFGGHPNE